MTVSNQNLHPSVGDWREPRDPLTGGGTPAWLTVAPIIAAGAAVGVAFSSRPFYAIVAIVGICAAAGLAMFYRAVPRAFLAFMGAVLIGYAFVGRGFAYLGVPPLFIGEMTLAFGLVAALVSGSLLRLARSPIAWLIVALSLWGLTGTVPYYATYGLDSLRDATLWGYGAFAFVVAACILGSGSLPAVVKQYGRVITPFAVWVPLLIIAGRTIGESLPNMPGTDVPMLSPKQGDAGVHLAGAAAFVLLGLNTRLSGDEADEWRGSRLFWLAWTIAFMCVAALNRGGFLSACAALFVLSVFKPVSVGRRLATWVMAAVLVAGAGLVLVNLETSFAVAERSEERTVSPRQIVENIRSLVGLESRAASYNLSSTSGWRLDWWKAIADYTLYGRYFWTGKGFGVNLADDDGFQVSQEYEAPLRSPHNAHMTVLARMGVPGAVLWMLLQLVFAASLVTAYFRARAAGEYWWAQVDLWILIYWIAFIANASFDVFLEGPQGGIWFWCLIGLGIAALESQRRISSIRAQPVWR
jgi:hypothetical protein